MIGIEEKKLEVEVDFSQPRFMIMGVGRAGSNMVERVKAMEVASAELAAVSTNKAHLSTINDEIIKVLIGSKVTEGQGAKGKPEVGEKAIEASKESVLKLLEGVNFLFLIGGLGGGTGTGAMPVIARMAKQQGLIVASIVVFPLDLEKLKQFKAEDGIIELEKYCDSVIVIDNNRLVELLPNLAVSDAFKVADEVIARTLKEITETVGKPSLISLEFSSLREVMQARGVSMICIGEGNSVSEVDEVVEDTLKNALLDVDITRAGGALIHINGGIELTLEGANKIGEKIFEKISENARTALSARVEEGKQGIEVIAVFTGVSSPFAGGKMQKLEERDSRFAIRGKDGKIRKGKIIEV